DGHRRNLHRRRRLRRTHGGTGHHQITLHTGRSGRGFHGGHRQGPHRAGIRRRRPRSQRRRDQRGQPRHHGGHEPVAGRQSRRSGFHHQRGLRGGPRDRPTKRSEERRVGKEG